MKKALILALVLAATRQPVRAEIVMGMYPLEIKTTTETLRGYLILRWTEDFDASKPAALELIRKQTYPLSLYESLERTAPLTYGAQPNISSKKPRKIRPQDFVSIKPLDWPRAGEQVGDIAIVSSTEAALLKSKPLASCRSKIWDCDYWLSYSTNVVQSELDALCDRKFEHRPTEEEQKALLSKPGALHFSYFCD